MSQLKDYLFYQDDWATIYCGDCLEIMPLMEPESVDLVVTDPPYGLNYNNGDLANCWESAFGGDKSRQIARPIENDDEEKACQQFIDFLKIAKDKLLNLVCT